MPHSRFLFWSNRIGYLLIYIFPVAILVGYMWPNLLVMMRPYALITAAIILFMIIPYDILIGYRRFFSDNYSTIEIRIFAARTVIFIIIESAFLALGVTFFVKFVAKIPNSEILKLLLVGIFSFILILAVPAVYKCGRDKVLRNMIRRACKEEWK